MRRARSVPPSVHIAFAAIGGVRADFRLTPSGIPVIVFPRIPKDISHITLPLFWELDELCSSQSYQKEGQAFLITDILVREGFCTYANGSSMRECIRQNLRNRNCIYVSSDTP